MNARFRVVSMQCARKVIVPSLVVVWAASCAVFPDEALLPADGAAGAPAAAAAAGHDSEAQGGIGASNGTAAGSGHDAGAPGGGLSGAGAGAEPLGGASPGSAGACAIPRQVRVLAAADTWIESAKPTAKHGEDLSLLVTGDPDAECRALLSFPLPVAPAGATLLRGTVTLQLESNTDRGLVERHLELSRLEQDIAEDGTTWNNWNMGDARWSSLGGDFGAAIASATILALTPSGSVSFDITATLETAWSTSIVPLPLIVREVGDTPTPPAELAFVSRERDALVPELLMEYCD